VNRVLGNHDGQSTIGGTDTLDANDREHVYSEFDVPTTGEDTSLPADWRDISADIQKETERRQRVPGVANVAVPRKLKVPDRHQPI